MSEKMTGANWLCGLLGAVAGGAIGYFVFFALVRQGLYAMVLPGALVGLGCGALSGGKSTALGVVCGLAALALGLFIEWRFAPFVADASFPYFLAHAGDLRPMTLILILLGGFLAFWFGRGRAGGAWLVRRRPATLPQ